VRATYGNPEIIRLECTEMPVNVFVLGILR
jgi:hypothetical protein